ncbi:hypothetical protein D3C87_2100840 [compost metagenome]
MALQHLIELRSHRPVDQQQIVDCGNDDIHLDAAARGGDERADQFAVRQEIG